jgi:hypothetical protein
LGIQKRVIVIQKTRKSTIDIPDLRAISLAQLVCASPGIRRLWTTKCKIMHGNRCKRKHVENHLNKLYVKKVSKYE